MNPRRRTAPRLRSSRTLPQGSGRSGRVCAGRAAGGDPRPAPRRQAEGRPGPGGRAACAAHFRGDVAQGGELVRPTVPGRGEPVPAERGVGAGPASARHVVLERPPGTVTSPRKPSGTRMKEPRPRGASVGIPQDSPRWLWWGQEEGLRCTGFGEKGVIETDGEGRRSWIVRERFSGQFSSWATVSAVARLGARGE